jgi:hypothetical protein
MGWSPLPHVPLPPPQASTVDAPHLRPAFDVELDLDPDTAMAELRQRLDATPRTRRCQSRGRCAELFVDDEDRHLWSPYLSVQAEPAPGGRTRLHGRFAPHPEVWTFFMFAYGVAWFAVLFGGALGYAQWASHEAAWGLWGVWVGLPMVAALHAVSELGQRLGHEQMVELRERLDGLVSPLPAPGVDPRPPAA